MKKNSATLVDQSLIVKLQSILMIFAVFSVLSYVYVVGISVTYAVAEKELAQEKKILSSEVLELESQYLTQSQNFSAHDNGASTLVALHDKSFIQATHLGSAQPIVVAN